MLNLRSRPNATAEERLAALRRLRDERRQAEDSSGSSANVDNVDEGLDASRRKRMSVRLQDVFSVRTRRGTDANVAAEASRSSPATVSGAEVPNASTSNPNLPRETANEPQIHDEGHGRNRDASR
jgi:hypothetical protein